MFQKHLGSSELLQTVDSDVADTRKKRVAWLSTSRRVKVKSTIYSNSP